MPVSVYKQYERAVDKIVGLETLVQLDVSLFPNLSVEGQKEVRAKYRKMAALNEAKSQRFEDAIKDIQSWQMKK